MPTTKSVVRDSLAVLVTAALAVLVDHYINVRWAWITVVVGCLALAWLHGLHKPIGMCFFVFSQSHRILTVWIVAIALVMPIILPPILKLFETPVGPTSEMEAEGRIDMEAILGSPLPPLTRALVQLPASRPIRAERPSTPCTMKEGTYYSTALSLPGGPNLKRPLFELEGTYKTAWYWENDRYWLLMEVALTNRGEASIAKDWELCLEQDNKPVMFEPTNIPKQGIVLADGESISENDMLMDTAVKEQVGHGRLMSGWIAFSIPRVTAETLKADPKLPNGTLRFKDYLAHTYSYDFVGRDRPEPNVYVPGKN